MIVLVAYNLACGGRVAVDDSDYIHSMFVIQVPSWSYPYIQPCVLVHSSTTSYLIQRQKSASRHFANWLIFLHHYLYNNERLIGQN